MIFLDGYRFGVPLYFEVGVFDFNTSLTNKTELELSRMDVHSQTVLTSAVTAQQQHNHHNHNQASSGSSSSDKKFPHRVMGTALFEVGQILGSRGNIASKSLQSGGVLTVHMERCQTHCAGRLALHLTGHKLKPATRASSSSAYYELYRKVDRPTGATWESVYRSNVVKHSVNPQWNPVNLDLDAACNGDLERAMKVIVWDHKRSGKHKFLGECETTLQAFAAAGEEEGEQEQQQQGEMDGFELLRDSKLVGRLHVVSASLSGGGESVPEGAPGGYPHLDEPFGGGGDPKTHNNNNNNNNGTAIPHTSPSHKPHNTSRRRPEFVDYLSGGCQISLAVAIDFTASNGDPREPGTPHYFHPPQSKEWNDYEKAIFAVGSILAKYDSDQRMPVWGFGAKYNGIVRHCFQCGQDVEVEGVQGIMDAYRGVFRTPLTMSYPTKLNEVIETAASYARHEQVSAPPTMSRSSVPSSLRRVVQS